MLIRSIGLPGMVNGTRMIIKGIPSNTLKCKVLTGTAKNEMIYMPRILFIVNEPYSFSRLQFPVRLSYAMTINKSQGQTLQKVMIKHYIY